MGMKGRNRHLQGRVTALALAAAMAFSTAACGKKDGGGSKDNGEYSGQDIEYLNLESATPIVKEGYEKTLNVWMLRGNEVGKAEDTYTYKYVTQVLNINLEITEIKSSAMSEQLSLAFGADQLPDIIIGGSSYLSASKVTQYGEEGQLVDIAPYLNESLMPNLSKIYEENPEYKNAVQDSEGRIFSLGLITNNDSGTSVKRQFLNFEMLESVDGEVPKTIDEFLDLMRTFKALGDDIIPIGGNITNNGVGLLFLNALGYVTEDNKGYSPALRNGEVVIPYLDEEVYSEYIRLMRTCYEEGLIDQDYFTATSTTSGAYVSEGRVGFMGGGMIPYVYTTDYLDWWGLNPLTSSYSDEQVWPCAGSALSCGGFVVTSECEDVELALRFADWMYSKHNYDLSNLGPNTTLDADELLGVGGWYFGEAPGFAVYEVDLIESPDKWDGLNDYLNDQIRLWSAGCWGMHANDGCYDELGWYAAGGPFDTTGVTDTTTLRLEKLDGEVVDGVYHAEISNFYEVYPYITQEVYPKNVFLSTDLNNEVAELKTTVLQYAETEIANFIVGRRPLSELSDYFAELMKMGGDRLLEIYTDYYNGLE